MKKWMFLVLSAGLLLGLGGCGAGKTKQDILTKAKPCKNKSELRKALGEPDADSQTHLMGQEMSVWKYKTADGEVVFEITDS